MADINLLQTQIKDTTQTATNRTRLVVWLSLIILIVLVATCGVLYFMTDSKNKATTDLNNKNVQLQSDIDSKEAELSGARAFQAKLANIQLLIKSHLYFTPLFSELEHYTYIKTQYTNLDLNQETGKVHLEGLVDSYNGLGKLLLGLNSSSHFLNVKLISVVPSASTSVVSYHFSIDMQATPDIFKNK